MRQAVLVAGLCALSILVGAAPKRQVNYYIFTVEKDEKGFAAPDLKDRTDSLNDFLNSFIQEKDILFVRTLQREKADVIIEVLGREMDPNDSDLRTVHLRLTVGAYVQLVDGRDDGGDWSDAAGNAAKQTRRWIYANYDQVVKGRTGK
jgi:site-specific recombinase